MRKIVEAGGRSIGVFNVRGELFALRNRCPHQGGPLCEGKLWSAVGGQPGAIEVARQGEIVGCGWHGWEFDIRTGQSWCEPERLRVRAYEVSVQALEPDPSSPVPGRVKGPYVAETYPVTVDGEYVVVEVAS